MWRTCRHKKAEAPQRSGPEKAPWRKAPAVRGAPSFFNGKTAPPHPACGALWPLWGACRPFWASSSKTLMERARAARPHEEPEQRLLHLKLILSVAWRTTRDTLRAFHLALVQAKAMYGIAVWHWGASPASRSTPNSAQYQRSKMISGIPKGSRMEDAVLETEPRPLPDVVLGRRFRCALLCETRGSALRPSAPIVRRPAPGL
ncbi:hypothetical protein C3747_7g209 [Trypanosoma cruzi]|uniref:Uncharacterized protein n=1 Tax=Trypanosoma cruzi TaxID=5693 RepID=A0A2V2XN72_TRYCR|nr:hypothetical protein C3747_7g209 [Trypanosoma cruzi]